jgi:chitinase
MRRQGRDVLLGVAAVLALGSARADALDCSGIPAWSSTTTYAAGTKVTRTFVAGSGNPGVYNNPGTVGATYAYKNTNGGRWGDDPVVGSNWSVWGALMADGNTIAGSGQSASPCGVSATATATATTVRVTPTRTNTATATRTPTATSSGPTATRTNTATATATTGGPGCTLPVFASCTAYALGTSVVYNGTKYTAIGTISATRDCPPASPYNPSNDNWWRNDGACTGGPTATRTATATATNGGPTATFTVTATRTATATATTTGPTATRTVTPTSCGNCGGNKKLVGYFEQWAFYHQLYYVKNIETSGSAAKLTHINYSFGNVINNRCSVGVTALGVGDAYADYTMGIGPSLSVDGIGDTAGDALKGHWNQLRKLKARHPGLKVLISLGGWTWSDGFYTAAQPANRSAFVASCVDAYIRGNLPVVDGAGGPGAAAGVFDGIDIDWEYPGACGLHPNCGASTADRANFNALMAEFRSQLNAVRPGLLLTAALPAGDDKYNLLDLATLTGPMDYFNLMTYDFHGDWDPTTNFMAPLFSRSDDPTPRYNANFAVQGYRAAGVSMAKMNLGVPFYGRGWAGVADVNNGLYQAGYAAPSSYSQENQPGYESYLNLAPLQNSYRNVRDAQAQAFYIFNGNTFWSYDDPTSVTNKMNYLKSNGLGGAMVWALTHDTPAGTLITAVSNGLQ